MINNIVEMATAYKNVIAEYKTGNVTLEEITESLLEATNQVHVSVTIIKDIILDNPNDNIDELTRFAVKEQIKSSLSDFNEEQIKESVTKLMTVALLSDKELGEKLFSPFISNMIFGISEVMNLLDDRKLGDIMLNTLNELSNKTS